MSAAKHTPAPWADGKKDIPIRAIDQEALGFSIIYINTDSVARKVEAAANARLIAAAPDLLAAVESEYIFLADIHNEWPGRHTPEGQMKLCRLRDLICKATGRESQDVQDDYGNRNLAKAEVQS
jgi:hypothetical protein